MIQADFCPLGLSTSQFSRCHITPEAEASSADKEENPISASDNDLSLR